MVRIKAEARYYYVAWQPTLIHANAVVRLYGRKGETQRLISPQPFASLEEAWPLIRSVIKTGCVTIIVLFSLKRIWNEND